MDAAWHNAGALTRHFRIFVASLALYLPLLLLADAPGRRTQLSLGLATAAFLWLFARGGGVPPRQIITAIIVAGTGECVLSLGWGLYSYRNALIPLYVFFGHGIFYAVAAESARQKALQNMAPAITRWVIAAGSLNALITLLFFGDTWGLLWWLLAVALIASTGNRLLVSTCFVYTMLLEWLGTAIGNWTWAAEVPYVGLTSANPPSGVGVLYILLDIITVAIASRLPGGTVDELRAPAPDVTVAMQE